MLLQTCLERRAGNGKEGAKGWMKPKELGRTKEREDNGEERTKKRERKKQRVKHSRKKRRKTEEAKKDFSIFH